MHKYEINAKARAIAAKKIKPPIRTEKRIKNETFAILLLLTFTSSDRCA